MTLSLNGLFYKAQKHLSDQASRALYSLNSLFQSKQLYIQDKLKLFDALVSPIMNYGCRCEIWGFHNSKDIEKVHLRVLKQILNVRQQTSNMIVYGELARVLFHVIRKVRIIKYWFKILADPFSLLFKVYKQQAIDVDNNRNLNSWSANVKT